jgi:ABC-type multidrug transport system ATPase subunit
VVVLGTSSKPSLDEHGVRGESRPAVVIDQVTTGYVEGRPVLSQFELAVPRGGLSRLSGPNGTGKSTVVELISGYLRPWAGTVSVLGMPAHSPRARQRRSVVRTQPALYDFMTVRDHLAFFARTLGDERDRLVGRAERLGLAPWFDENARSLSSGTAKKLWYVLCTAGSAELLVLDEPFNAVDSDGVELMVAELTEFAGERTVLMVCHTQPSSLRFDHEVVMPGEGAR